MKIRVIDIYMYVQTDKAARSKNLQILDILPSIRRCTFGSIIFYHHPLAKLFIIVVVVVVVAVVVSL